MQLTCDGIDFGVMAAVNIRKRGLCKHGLGEVLMLKGKQHVRRHITNSSE